MQDQVRWHYPEINRRQLLRSAAIAAGGIFVGKCSIADSTASYPLPPLAIFSKVYQELKLDFDASAEVTAETGLDGVDCAVRVGGEILPERAADDMPRYNDALAKHGRKMLLMTTDIVGIDTPHAADILTAGKQLGIRYYRLGFYPQQTDVPVDKQTAQIQTSLKEVAALNAELGVCAVFENHSVVGTLTANGAKGARRAFVGGDLNQLYEIVKEFNPDQIAVAFDIGHAIIMHGPDWRTHFERLSDHIRIVYIKDVLRTARFVPFGEGELGKTDFFQLLQKRNYREPLCIHIEYSSGADSQKTRAALVDALTASKQKVVEWWQDTEAKTQR